MSATVAQDVDSIQLATARQAVSLVADWVGVPTKIDLQESPSRRVFKVTSSERPGEGLIVRLLRSQHDLQLVETTHALAAAGLGPPVLAANSTAVVQPWLHGAALEAPACRGPTVASRLGQFVASLHCLPTDGPVAPKARPEDLLCFARELTETNLLPVAAAEEFLAELQRICTVLSTLPVDAINSPGQRLVWTHGSLSLENLLDERWPVDLVPLYEGTISHPAVGQNVEIRVQLESATRGRWQAQGQTEDVSVSAVDGHIEFRNLVGTIKLSGMTPAAGCIRGEVIHNGVRGGSFVLIGLTETRVEPQLKVVDLEMAGRRPASTDISYLFLTWGLADGVRYPSLETRRAFAQAYLSASGYSTDPTLVDNFLWVIECESLLQAAWLGLSSTLASASGPHQPLVSLAMQLFSGLPAARAAVANAIGEPALRASILEHGAFGVR